MFAQDVCVQARFRELIKTAIRLLGVKYVYKSITIFSLLVEMSFLFCKKVKVCFLDSSTHPFKKFSDKNYTCSFLYVTALIASAPNEFPAVTSIRNSRYFSPVSKPFTASTA